MEVVNKPTVVPGAAAEGFQRPKVKSGTQSVEKQVDNPKPESDPGTYNDYTVNSENELVIRVREMYTGKEIKEIPSKEAQATHHAHRKAVGQIIDKTA